MLEINHNMKVLRFVGYQEPIKIGQYYLDIDGNILEITVDTPLGPIVENRAIFEAKPVIYCFDGVWFKQGDTEEVVPGHWYLSRPHKTPFLALGTAPFSPDNLIRLIPINSDYGGGSQAIPENMTVTVTAPDTGMILSSDPDLNG